MNYDSQGAAITKEKLKNTPKNTKSAYSLKVAEFQAFHRSLYGSSACDQLVTTDKLLGFIYQKAHRGKYVINVSPEFLIEKITMK